MFTFSKLIDIKEGADWIIEYLEGKFPKWEELLVS